MEEIASSFQEDERRDSCVLSGAAAELSAGLT